MFMSHGLYSNFFQAYVFQTVSIPLVINSIGSFESSSQGLRFKGSSFGCFVIGFSLI